MEDRSANDNAPVPPIFAVNVGSHVGNQINYINGQPSKPLDPTERNPCISPPTLRPVSTFVDRPILSKEIASKLQKSCGNRSLAHALAVTGLGGIGKTQLVLHYIDTYKKRYDTILWIDAHDESSVRSSFERCCNTLSLGFARSSDPTLLQDAAPVQKLLGWLATRSKEQKWLVIFDNADTLPGLSLVIPCNASAGSVLVTSQDGNAARLLVRAKTTVVDRMEIPEAKALLIHCLDLQSPESHGRSIPLLEELSNSLDGIALAVDLAGARIRIDMDNMHDIDTIDVNDAAVITIQQYLLDLDKYKKSVLSETENNDISQYTKTIWTVWETVLASLKRHQLEDSQNPAFPLQLLKLAAILGPNIIHREVFRSASQSLHDVLAGLRPGVEIPHWFKCLLKLAEDKTWDDFAYRKSLDRLIRFHLVRPVSEEMTNRGLSGGMESPLTMSWPGFAFHGLVRWRTRAETTEKEYELCQVVLTTACSRASNEYVDGLDFRQVLQHYLPQFGHVWQLQDLTFEGIADLWSTFGTTFLGVRDFRMAGHFLPFAYLLRRRMLGPFDPATIETGLALDWLGHISHTDKYEAIAKELEAMLNMVQHFGPDMSLTSSIYEYLVMNLAVSNSIDMIWPTIAGWMKQYMTAFCLPNDTRANRAAKEHAQRAVCEKAQEEIAKSTRVLSVATEQPGRHHRAFIGLKSSLASMHALFTGHEVERTHLEDLMICVKQKFGDKYCGTLQVMQRLAMCQAGLLDFELAIQFMKEVVQLSRQVLGHDDPRTQLRESLVEALDEEVKRQKLSPQERETKDKEDHMAFVNKCLSRPDLPSNVREILMSKDVSEMSLALLRILLSGN